MYYKINKTVNYILRVERCHKIKSKTIQDGEKIQREVPSKSGFHVDGKLYLCDSRVYYLKESLKTPGSYSKQPIIV